MDKRMKEHWERVYSTKEVNAVGWYEETPASCLKLLSKCDIGRGEPALDVGAGASSFADCLLEAGFRDVIALDISETALNKMKERLGSEKAAAVRWIVDDVTRPSKLREIGEVALWHDRAVLHFFTEEEQRAGYLSTLKKVVRKGGYVIIGVFSLEGAKKCSGLDLKNYDQDMLAGFLGGDFELLEHFKHVHQMPSGDPRPYVYTLFRRTAIS